MECSISTVLDLFLRRKQFLPMDEIIYQRLGPAIGPIADGFITQTIGVKWIFIVIVGLSYFLFIISAKHSSFSLYPGPWGVLHLLPVFPYVEVVLAPSSLLWYNMVPLTSAR